MARTLGRRRRRRLVAFCNAMLASREAGERLAAAVLRAGPAPGTADARLGLYRRAVELCGSQGPDDGRSSGIRAALAALPTDQRAALLLREAERLSRSQIATVLGVSAAAVPPLLVAARLALADAVAARKAGDHAIDSSVNWVESRAA